MRRVSAVVFLLIVCGLACCPAEQAGPPPPADTDTGSDTGTDVAPRFDTSDTGPPFDTSDAAIPPDTIPEVDAAGPDTPADTDPEVDAGLADPWRSVLYPEDWAPGFQTVDGLFVHDFSYAGYHNSEIPIPTVDGVAVFDVLEQGADPSATSDSTAAIQAAIDAAEAAGGGVVLFPAGLYRCDDLLTVTASGVVLRGEGPEESRIYFTRHQDMTQKSHIRVMGSVAASGEFPLAENGDPWDSTVLVADATGLVPGDDVGVGWVITDAFVEAHGMTGTWAVLNGTWQAFFRREVVSVDTSSSPHVVTLDVPLRYPAMVSDGASLRKETGYISEVGIEDLGLSNAVGWDEAWANDRVHVLAVYYVKDGWIRNVATFPSPVAPTSGDGANAHLQNGGIKIHTCKRFTVADTTMEKAQDRGGGGCGYLFEVQSSNEVLFRDCIGRAGRHNFIQNYSFGVTGCVWLRCLTEEGFKVDIKEFPDFGATGTSEFHHFLAMANLIDSCTIHDGWKAVNRQDWSSGAGHTATESVFWNSDGDGTLVSRQWGVGYVIGTSGDLTPITTLDDGPFNDEAEGTEPEDFIEGLGEGDSLDPPSLFEDQLQRRLSVPTS